MSTITTKDGTQIDYNERGQGLPVVFSHGWPLSAVAFEDQMFFPASRGCRCIAHDRRLRQSRGGERLCLLRRSFRNWFQPHYRYVYAGFPCVSSSL